MKGLIYLNPFLYNLAVRVSYGGDFRTQYELVAGNIENGWSVLDLCCGDCYLKKFLNETIKYEARDFNRTFIRHAKAKGINASYCDLKGGLREKKKFDCVIMMASLYQFIPEEDGIINSMKKTALKRVIINEPIRNAVSSPNRFVSTLAKVVSNPGGQKMAEMKRFSADSLTALFERHGVTRLIDTKKTLIGIFDL